MQNPLEINKTDSLSAISKVNFGTREMHVAINGRPGTSLATATREVFDRLSEIEHENGFTAEHRLFGRLFLSDAVNQVAELKREFKEIFKYNLSIVEQPPYPQSSLALWMYLVKGEESVRRSENLNMFISNGLQHIYMSAIQNQEVNQVFEQTKLAFDHLLTQLEHHGGNLLDNTIRTWLFVRDIDNRYNDVVRARNEVFGQHGLNEDSHFISSTGIEGRHWQKSLKSFMDAYAIVGMHPEQVSFLKASEHFCPTSKYGVAFERGTVVSYGDRKHIFISGTASIDNNGNVMFPSSFKKQTVRIMKNIEALLSEAGSTIQDMVMAIVYVRDSAHLSQAYTLVERYMPGTPYIVVHAPICRPQWLIEIEGMAVTECRSDWPDF